MFSLTCSLACALLVAASSTAWLQAGAATRHLRLEELELPRHLAHSAPYAIQSDHINEATTMRNIILKMAANESAAAAAAASGGGLVNAGTEERQQQQQQHRDEQRTGSLAGIRANLNLRKLLEALELANVTSEVRFENDDSTLINITISNIKDSDKIDSLFLEEFLVATGEASSMEAAAAAASHKQAAGNDTASGVLKDNHQQPAPAQRAEEKRQLVRVGDHLSSIMSANAAVGVPPIRTIIEAVPENYTMRRVAEEANVFALKLLHQLNTEKLGARNLIQAPFPVYQGLALLLTGAMGDTSRELERVLLGSQAKLATHHQDRPRLLASFSDSVRQLQLSATHHFRVPINESGASSAIGGSSVKHWVGGTQEQHLVVANNLLFSPAAYEIAPEFKANLDTYYNNTALTRIEIGSTESIHKINSWIRAATGGLIPTVIHKKSTFDEFNVMALLCTSWLAQEWHDTFYRISSPVRSSIRLKGQARALDLGAGGNLLEFEDDNKHSHFVDFIKSRPTEHIQHYHSHLAGQLVDIVSVPLKHSNHRLVALTPITSGNPQNNPLAQAAAAAAASQATANNLSLSQAEPVTNTSVALSELPDSSALSRFIAALATTGNPAKALRGLWNIVAPEIITKQVLKTLEESRPARRGAVEGDELTVAAATEEQETGRKADQVSVTDKALPQSQPQAQLVQLSMPVIRGEADSSISAALNHIGLVNAFDPNQANFIGINGHPFNYYKLHLSNVLSKTTFNLNEQGINYDKTIRTLESLRIFPNRQNKHHQQQPEIEEDSEEEQLERRRVKSQLVDQVRLNKPFMYLICDIRTKLILYTGVVRNPEQEGP